MTEHVTDEQESAAIGVLRASYWDDVRSYAEEIASEAVQQDAAERDDWMYDRLHETADGSQWVIYTYRAYLVAGLLSEHRDAYEDEIGGRPGGADVDADVTTLAFWALRADIQGNVSILMAESDAE